MAKIVYRSLKTGRKGKPSSVRPRRVRNPEGRWVTVYSVDADSPAFDEGITYVFRRNVARARAEQKRRSARSGLDAAKS